MKRIRWNGFLLGVFTLLSLHVTGQQDEQLTLYNYNPLYYNPAYAGSRDALSFSALGRFQWVNFEGAPTTQWFSAHAPVVGNALGMGVHLVNDKIGARNRTSAYYDVSSGIRLNQNNARLAFGLSGGVDIMSSNFSNLTVHDATDPYYGQNLAETRFNMGAGIYYYSERSYIGISIPRVLEVKSKNVQNLFNFLNQRHLFFSAGHVFTLNSVMKLKPTVLVKFTPNTRITVDANVNLLLYNRLWLGALYRYQEAVGISAVFKVREFMHVGYSYDFPINRLASYQSGSHEILLQFDVKFKNSIYTSPRYF